MVVVLLLVQGGDVGECAKGTVQDSFMSSVFDSAPPASDMPAFPREVVERLFVIFPCRPPALRAEFESVVPDRSGGESYGRE